eukprot:242605-Amphidinium_carterae.1
MAGIVHHVASTILAEGQSVSSAKQHPFLVRPEGVPLLVRPEGKEKAVAKAGQQSHRLRRRLGR